MILLLDENLMGSIYTDPQTCELQDGIFGSDDWPTVAKTSSDESHVDNYEAPNFNARLKRGFDENYNLDTDPSTVAYYITAYPGFKQFSGWIEGRPHGICHLFLSFSMSIMFSPDDPCFWLHHTNIDRLYHWWADCWDYESVKTPGTNQYTAANPISKNGYTAYNPYTGEAYNVDGSSKIPYYLSQNKKSYIFPDTTTCSTPPCWPTPNQLWPMGTTTSPGYDGINYRYGPDVMCQNNTFGQSCKNNLKGWNWVNQPYTQKRSLDEEIIGSTDTHPKLANLHELGNILKDEVAKGKSHEVALKSLAMSQCEKASKLKLTEKTLDWIRMNNLHISDFDTLCDKPSERLAQESVKEDQSTTNLNGSFVPLWVIISASIGTAIVLIAIVVLIIIYMRKKSVSSNSEYSYSEMK